MRPEVQEKILRNITKYDIKKALETIEIFVANNPGIILSPTIIENFDVNLYHFF